MSYHCRLIHSSSRWKWELRLMILMQAFSTNSRPVRQLRLLAALGCTCPLRSQSSSRALWISTRCVSYFLSEFWGSDDHHAILKHCCFSSRVSRQTRLPVLGWEEKFVNLCAGHFECSTFLAAIQQQQHQPPPAQELSRILLIQIDGFFCSFSSTATSLCTYPCLITWPDRVEEKHEGYKDNYHCIGARIVRKNEDLDGIKSATTNLKQCMYFQSWTWGGANWTTHPLFILFMAYFLRLKVFCKQKENFEIAVDGQTVTSFIWLKMFLQFILLIFHCASAKASKATADSRNEFLSWF